MKLVLPMMVLLFLGVSACQDSDGTGPKDSGVDAGSDAGTDAGFDAADGDAGLDAADDGLDGEDGGIPDGAADENGDAADEDEPFPKNWDELIWDQDLWG